MLRRMSVIACFSAVLAATLSCARAEPPVPGLFKVQVDGKWGFIDQSGKMVVQPRFDQAFGSAELRVTARDATSWFSLELEEGKSEVTVKGLLCKPDAELISEIGGGLYRLVTAEYEKSEIFDPQGRFQAKYDEDWAFGALQEGRLPIKQGGKWGVVDRNGRVLVQPKYERVFNFFEGKAGVRLGEKWGYIDRDGKVVLELARGMGCDFAEGFAVVADGGEMWFIKPDGTPAFDRRFSVAHGFSEGLAAVCDATERFGYIDHTGKYVIEPKYDAARDFSDGLAAIKIAAESDGNGKKLAGYIDPKGKMVIRLADAVKHYSFRRGLALVQTGEWMGYIDKTGRVVWKTAKPWNLPFVEQD